MKLTGSNYISFEHHLIYLSEWRGIEKEVVKANKEVTEASRVFYPTNQKLDNLNSDQIYFKNRLERIQAGGKWNFRKFSTLFRRHCFS